MHCHAENRKRQTSEQEDTNRYRPGMNIARYYIQTDRKNESGDENESTTRKSRQEQQVLDTHIVDQNKYVDSQNMAGTPEYEDWKPSSKTSNTIRVIQGITCDIDNIILHDRDAQINEKRTQLRRIHSSIAQHMKNTAMFQV